MAAGHCNEVLPNWGSLSCMLALGSWKSHFAFGEFRPTSHSPNSWKENSSLLEESLAVLEMGLELSAQDQASLVACPELRLLLQAACK